jgi:hypothetical protein
MEACTRFLIIARYDSDTPERGEWIDGMRDGQHSILHCPILLFCDGSKKIALGQKQPFNSSYLGTALLRVWPQSGPSPCARREGATVIAGGSRPRATQWQKSPARCTTWLLTATMTDVLALT